MYIENKEFEEFDIRYESSFNKQILYRGIRLLISILNGSQYQFMISLGLNKLMEVN